MWLQNTRCSQHVEKIKGRFNSNWEWLKNAPLEPLVFIFILAHLSYAQDELLWSLCPSSIRPLIFSNDFSSEGAEAILLKFHMEPP